MEEKLKSRLKLANEVIGATALHFCAELCAVYLFFQEISELQTKLSIAEQSQIEVRDCRGSSA